MTASDFDIAILGGGLAGGLVALALARLRPELRLAIVEASDKLGGDQIWSFFASDIAAADAWLVEPLIAARWDAGYDVQFPGHARTLTTAYRSVTSAKLEAALCAALPASARLTSATVTKASATAFTLADGRSFTAGAVIDARGALGLPGMAGGWQKFLGRRLRLTQPHGLARPVVMDARVEQLDGFRFVYLLPFAADEMFIEDTYYSTSPALDSVLLGARIDAYCQQRGWQVAELLHEEAGVLPVIGRGHVEALWHGDGADAPARAGMRAGLVHPVTSYSLPDAVRLASFIVRQNDLGGAALAQAVRGHVRRHWRAAAFYRRLTRLMFGATRADRRYKVLEHFYRKPQAMIERFYAGRSTLTDQFRLFSGRPPVPVSSALAVLTGGGDALAPLDGRPT